MSDFNFDNFDPDASRALAQATKTGNSIELPFTAPLFYWKNGRPDIPESGTGVLHFGGWFCDSELFAEARGPKAWTPEIVVKPDATSYSVVGRRNLNVATIARRSRWITDKQTKKSHSHTQYLVWLATYDKEQPSPFAHWTVGVLSAKGWSSKFMDDAVKKWQKETVEARSTFAKNAPANVFWMHIGTFFKEPVVKAVGNGNEKSFVTPCDVYVDEGWKIPERQKGLVMKHFVGMELVDKMNEVLQQVQDWLKDWKDNSQVEEDSGEEAAPAAKNGAADNGLPF